MIMKIDQAVRYYIEQSLLPTQLYSDGPAFISKFMEKLNRAIYQCYSEADAVVPGYTCPYTQKDFDVQYREYIAEKVSYLVVRVEMPAPENPLFCRAVYMCYSNYGSGELYFTSELNADGGFYLCAISEEGQRVNFGPSPIDSQEEFNYVSSLFKDLKYSDNQHCFLCLRGFNHRSQHGL